MRKAHYEVYEILQKNNIEYISLDFGHDPISVVNMILTKFSQHSSNLAFCVPDSYSVLVFDSRYSIKDLEKLF